MLSQELFTRSEYQARIDAPADVSARSIDATMNLGTSPWRLPGGRNSGSWRSQHVYRHLDH